MESKHRGALQFAPHVLVIALAAVLTRGWIRGDGALPPAATWISNGALAVITVICVGALIALRNDDRRRLIRVGILLGGLCAVVQLAASNLGIGANLGFPILALVLAAGAAVAMLLGIRLSKHDPGRAR